jgi:hypothetical protein
MNLPTIISSLISAQNDLDPASYAACFEENATVFDEGKDHHGKPEIQRWNAAANEKYKSFLTVLGYSQDGENAILEVEVTGTFEGSPARMAYHMELSGGLIRSLKIN